MLAVRSRDFEAAFGRSTIAVERLALNAISPARHPLATSAGRFRDADRILANDSYFVKVYVTLLDDPPTILEIKTVRV